MQVDTVLAPQHGSLFLPQNQASIPTYGHINDYNNSQYSEFPNGPIHPDFTQYDMGYMSLYDVNSTPDYPSSSPSRPTGYKHPSLPTPLLGTSPKRAHLSMHYDDVNWDSPSPPALATVMALPFTPAKPVYKPVKLPRTPVPISMILGKLRHSTGCLCQSNPRRTLGQIRAPGMWMS
jgi:hypothetical protein